MGKQQGCMASIAHALRAQGAMRLRAGLIMLALLPGYAAAGACDQILAQDRLESCLGDELSAADKQLNDVYGRLVTRLSAGQKLVLKKAQRAWLIYRDADCEMQGEQAVGGQAYQALIISCEIEKTQHRIVELEAQGGAVER